MLTSSDLILTTRNLPQQLQNLYNKFHLEIQYRQQATAAWYFFNYGQSLRKIVADGCSQRLIPRQAHYIWLGGPPPDHALRNIFRFSETNGKKTPNNFKITVWTDKPVSFLRSCYKAQCSSDLLLKFLAEKHTEIIDVESYTALLSCDQTQKLPYHKYFIALILRAMHGPYKILSQTSDILRLFALNKEGGIYMDVDVAVTTPIKNEELATFDGWLLGSIRYNCYLASVPESNIIGHFFIDMYQQISKLTKEYQLSAQDKTIASNPNLDITWSLQRVYHIKNNDSDHSTRWAMTIKLGPGTIQRVLVNWLKNNPDLLFKSLYILYSHNGNHKPKLRTINIGFSPNLLKHENSTKYNNYISDKKALKAGNTLPAINKGIEPGVAKIFKSTKNHWSIKPKVLNQESTLDINSGI